MKSNIPNYSQYIDKNGYARERISLVDILQQLPCKTEEDLLEIIQILEEVNEHNISWYLNTHLIQEERNNHEAICYMTTRGTAPFLRLKRMT